MRDGLEEVFPRLWRYCLAQTGQRDWANELAQMTSIRALEKAHLFDPETHLDRWLFRMAHNLWLNELRARRVRQGGGLVPVEDVDLPDTSSSTEVNILAREVFSFIEQLPEAQRVTVLLVYVEGFRYAEAAEVLEIPIGTVMSRLAAARKRLTTLAGEQKEKGT